MRATFFGFESVRKALMASQKGLDITGQNIANVNTKGYSRQRVDLTSISIDMGNSRFSRGKAGVIGQGVEITGITQIRDQFLDARYRKDIAEYGRWDARSSVLNDVENIFDEITSEGLHARFNDLAAKLQSFSLNPESVEFATIFRSSAQKVVDIFNQYSIKLDLAREQHIFNLGVVTDEINLSLEKIAALNMQIKNEMIQSVSPNELLDMRNLLLDRLSELAGCSYVFHSDGGVSVRLGEEYLIDSSKHDRITKLSVESNISPITLKLENGSVANITRGQAAGYLEALNGEGVYASDELSKTKGIPYFQQYLDNLADAFAKAFNDLNDSTGVNKLFDSESGDITAGSIKISDEWLKDSLFITRSTITPPEEGRNDNLLRMIELMDTKLDISPYFRGSFEECITSIIGDLSVEINYNEDMLSSSAYVLDTITNQRESIMGVSIDEEGINMIRFQKSYTAAARLMTVMDEALDVLINRMGIVGR